MDATQAEQVGQQVKAARQLKGWSAAALAAAADVAPNTVSAIENGRSVQAGSLRKVLDALGVEPLAAAQARVGYPVDVELVRDAIGLWLLDTPESERAAKVAALFASIAATRPLADKT